jgi:hypothetical protein
LHRIANARFGDLFANHDRLLARALTELKECLDDENDEILFNTKMVAHKSLHAVQQVCRASKLHGPASPGLFEVFKEQRRFLSATPVAEIRLPSFFVEQMHNVECAEAWPPAKFWELVSLPHLKDLSFCSAEGAEKLQMDLVVEKVINVTQGESIETVTVKLASLFSIDSLQPFEREALCGVVVQGAFVHLASF